LPAERPAKAILRAGEAPEGANEVFYRANGGTWTIVAVLRLGEGGRGVSPAKLHLPDGLVRFAGGLAERGAKLLGKSGRWTGIDVSKPMIAAGRVRAERERAPASFVWADAQAYAFQAGSFDMIVSRFGVMFFADPVQAFANLARAARDGAGLWFVTWRSAAENPFMITAERAAAPHLPDLPPREPDAPGAFALADAGRVARILEESGWTAIDIQPVDVPCTLPEKDLVRYLSRFGPVGMALAEADEPTRTRILQAVRAAFDPFVHGDEVRYTAACWVVRARTRVED
jgi:SAM-dependent methyltransferase